MITVLKLPILNIWIVKEYIYDDICKGFTIIRKVFKSHSYYFNNHRLFL